MTLRLVYYLLFSGVTASAAAQDTSPPAYSGPPYENQMIQMAETLGSLHYLSNLCGDKTSLWRDQMNMLLTTEKTDATRRKHLVSGFNNSYRSFADNYSHCTDQALKAIDRFKMQGTKLSENLLSHYGN